MNCKQARSVFSARLDNELTAEETRAFQGHLGHCPECDSRWSSFRMTVQLVRRLPQEKPDPAFIGQVLDRVRAYDEEQFLQTGTPLDREIPARSTLLALWDRLVDGVRSLAVPLWRPVPAVVVASMAVGMLVGFAAFQGGALTTTPSELTAQIETTTESTPNTPRQIEVPVSNPAPFADVAAELERRFGEESEDDETGTADPVELLDPTVWRSATGLQRNVRFQDERPRITF